MLAFVLAFFANRGLDIGGVQLLSCEIASTPLFACSYILSQDDNGVYIQHVIRIIKTLLKLRYIKNCNIFNYKYF